MHSEIDKIVRADCLIGQPLRKVWPPFQAGPAQLAICVTPLLRLVFVDCGPSQLYQHCRQFMVIQTKLLIVVVLVVVDVVVVMLLLLLLTSYFSVMVIGLSGVQFRSYRASNFKLQPGLMI